MTNILDLPDEIWIYLFHQKFLKIEHMVRLSEVCKKTYNICHNIKLFNYPKFDPFDQDQEKHICLLKKDFVKAWNNVAFIRYFPTPTYGVQPNYHYIFHTWNDCPNVYFHLFSTKWIDFEQSVKKLKNRIYFYSCRFDKLTKDCNIPYLKLTGRYIETKLGGGVKKVSIGFSDIQDLSLVRNLREVIIKFCNNIDLKTLEGSKIRKLEISNCDIQNLEGVEGVQNLVIEGRTRIQDYSPISKIPYLSILSSNIGNLDFVEQVKELDISESSRFIDVSILVKVDSLRKITVKKCLSINGLSELRQRGVEVIS